MRYSRAPGRSWVLIALIALCAGCLPIPHTDLMHPGVNFRVRDQAHVPITGARITFSRRRVIGSLYTVDTNVVTNDSGAARVTRVTRWHSFLFLVPDGEAGFAWKWRTDVPGYKSDSGTFGREPDDTVRITLERP